MRLVRKWSLGVALSTLACGQPQSRTARDSEAAQQPSAPSSGRGGSPAGMGGTAAAARDAGEQVLADSALTPDARPLDDGARPPEPAGVSALTVTSGERAVNECFSIIRVEGADVIVEGMVSAPAGASLLLWQVQDRLGRVGETEDVAAADRIGTAGIWELARVASTRTGAPSGFRLQAVPKSTYVTSADGRAAQACVVPDYTDVVVAGGAKLVARAWDGKTGGLVAFTATGTVTVDGEISANGLGFRGGPWSATHFHADDNPNKKMTDLNTTMGFGGFKGEGLDGSGFGPTKEGRGNHANGAGGGNNTHAGGGGGASAAKGGFGGMQHGFYAPGEPNTRGMPGVGVRINMKERLVMGGGGGQGQQVTNRIDPDWCKKHNLALKREEMTRGGAGGGAIVINAKALKGSGRIGADGLRGGCAEYDGAGGGGAGGAIWIAAREGDFSGTLSASGGAGGDNLNTNSTVGPGGGGGGGRVRAELPQSAKAKIEVKAGASGLTYSGRDPNARPPNRWGATDGATGAIETP